MRKTQQIGEQASKITIAICFDLWYNGDMKKSILEVKMSKEAKIRGNLELLDKANGYLFRAMDILNLVELESEEENYITGEMAEQIQDILSRFDEIESYLKYIEAI